MKTCSKCGASKGYEDFFKDSTKKDGRTSACKQCFAIYREENREKIAARQKVYYDENREKIAARQKGFYDENREDMLAYSKGYYEENRGEICARQRDSRYGLAPGDFKRMLSEQGGVCAICSGPGGKKGFYVDHDHESGKNRALLCLTCNFALGHLKDSSALAQLVVNYLKLHGK